MGIGLIVSALVDLMAHVFDLSDVAELGAAVLKVEVNKWNQWVKKGNNKIKEHLEPTIEQALRSVGYCPEELMAVWLNATVDLQTATLTPSALGNTATEAKESKT